MGQTDQPRTGIARKISIFDIIVMAWDSDEHDPELLACPSCGAEVYEDSEQCPHCGDWIMPLAAHARRPAWVRWVGLILAAVFLLSILGGLLRSLF